MEDIKLRLDFVRKFGVKLVENDKCTDGDGEFIKTICSQMVADVWNNNDDEFATITSFAPRKNTGSQPVGDDMPVRLNEGGCTVGYKCSAASDAEWENSSWYVTWQPDLDALIKMQIEHDARIDEETNAEFTKLNKVMSEVQNKNSQKKFDNGTKVSGNINAPVQGDKRRIEYLSNNSGQIEIELVTFMFETDKEICCLDSDGLMLVVDIEEFIAWHPVVSELEAAKKKQVDIILGDLTDTKMMKFNRPFTRKMLEIIQGLGHLAEIIQPLEK